MMIAVNGIQVSADERGAGEAVVFVCGTGQPAEMLEPAWRPALDALGLRTITYDNRGIPPTEVPEPPYAMQDLIDDAIGVIEYFDAGPCHLIGASLGANIVRSVAQQRPDLVASAVLRVGGGNFRPGVAEILHGTIAALDQGGDAAREAQRELIYDALLTRTTRHDDAAKEAVEPVLAMISNASDDWSGTIGQSTANLEWARRDHLDDAAKITVPVLMMANELDAYFAPEDLRAAADAMGDCTFVLYPGLAHVALTPDTHEMFERQVIDFIGAHRRG